MPARLQQYCYNFAGIYRFVGLREAFREQSLFGGQGMQRAHAMRLQSSGPLKGANAEMLECSVPAVAKYRFLARTNKTEIFLQEHLFHKMGAWKGKFWDKVSF